MSFRTRAMRAMNLGIRYRNLAVRHKLRLIIIFIVSAALILASGMELTYDQLLARHNMRNDLAVLAEIVGSNSTAAVAFRDQRAAEEILSGLRAKQHIVAATIYSDDGKPFASYRRDGEHAAAAPPLRSDGSWFEGDRLIVYRRILLHQQTAGVVFLESDLGGLHVRITRL